MNLSKLIHEIWKDSRIKALRLRKDEVEIIMEVFLEHIGRGILQHGVVKLRGLFTIDVRTAKGRKIRNPSTGETMFSKDYRKLGLKPSKKLKDNMQKEIS